MSRGSPPHQVHSDLCSATRIRSGGRFVTMVAGRREVGNAAATLPLSSFLSAPRGGLTRASTEVYLGHARPASSKREAGGYHCLPRVATSREPMAQLILDMLVPCRRFPVLQATHSLGIRRTLHPRHCHVHRTHVFWQPIRVCQQHAWTYTQPFVTQFYCYVTLRQSCVVNWREL